MNKSDKWKAENEFRRTLIQIFGGVIVIVGLFFTSEQVRQFYISQENMKLEQLSSRYSKAIELLSKKGSTNKIGAIYALEQIVEESPNYLKIVLDVLPVFVKQSEYCQDNEYNKIILPEVQAAMTVIARIKNKENTNVEKVYSINLTRAKLKGVELTSANLVKADLREAELINAEISYANMQEAILNGANMQGANLKAVNLKIAVLSGVDFQGANLDGADLEGAVLWFANLQSTNGLTVDQLLKVKTLYQVRGLAGSLRAALLERKRELFDPFEKE